MTQTSSILSNEIYSSLDREFARFLARRFNADDDVQLAAAMVSESVRNGHTCIDLDAVGGNLYGADPAISIPHPNNWRARLMLSTAVGGPGVRRPLIMDGKRLFLHRMHAMEMRLSEKLLAMTIPRTEEIPAPVLAIAKKLFDGVDVDLSMSGGNLQAAGAFLPFFFRLVVISGGPGTGKTTVLAKILALQLANAEALKKPLPVVALCAPTGKAAQRMAESLMKSAKDFVGILPKEHRDHFESMAPKTIHRLLGIGRFGGTPERNRDNPIEAEIVVVDESSMVDAGLMDALVSALPAHATLILLGDRSQLPSVDAGRVFADICDSASVNSFTADFSKIVNDVMVDKRNAISEGAGKLSHIVELQHSFRFKGDEAIGVVARAVNRGDEDEAVGALLRDHTGESTCRLETASIRNTVVDRMRIAYGPLMSAETPAKALAAIGRFMVLTVTNEGPLGREGINTELMGQGTPHVYPIMIVENDPAHDLYNGDIGVVMTSDTGVRAWFSDGTGEPRPFIPAQLPPFVTAFAITVHKSQGSEFDEIFCMIPDERPDGNLPVSRELLYTAITRAKKHCTLFGSEGAVRSAIGRKNDRMSGLRERLVGEK